MKTIMLLLLILFIGTFGCHSSRTLEKRIRFSIASKEQIYNSTNNKSARYISECLLNDLRHATPITLSNPKVSVSIYSLAENNDFIISIFWIGASPRADRILVEDQRSGNTYPLQIPREYIIENNEDAKKGVTFRAYLKVGTGTPLWKALGENDNTESNFNLRLDDDVKSASSKLKFWKEP